MNTTAIIENRAASAPARFVRGLALLAGLLLLASGAARAQSNACSANPGTEHSGTHECTAAEAQSGILYWGSNGLVLTIPGAAGSTVDIERAVGVATDQHRGGIVIYNGGAETSSGADDGDISLTIGASGAVNILQGASAPTYTGPAAVSSGNGIVISPNNTITATSSVTVDYRNGAIGTATTPMQNDGIRVNVWHATTAAHSITNAARIYAGGDGIEFGGNNGTGKASVTNSGAIDAARGIVLTWAATDNTGGAEIGNTGAIRATGAVGALNEADQPHGIYFYYGGIGRGKVTNSGAVTSSNAHGIFLNARWMAGAGDVEILNSGAIMAGKKGLWLQHGNPGTGAAAIRNNAGGTIAATDGHGIHLETRSTGAATIDNKANIAANGTGAHGIVLDAFRINDGTAAVTIANTAMIAANKDGIRLDYNNHGPAVIRNSGRIEADRGIYAVINGNGGIGIENSGQITADGAVDMLAEADQPHGIYLYDSGTGSAAEANPTIANSGGVTSVNAHGIFVNTEWKTNGNVRIANSGAIRAGRKGIWLLYGRPPTAQGATAIVNEAGGAIVAGTADGATEAHGIHLRTRSPAGAASIDNKANIAATRAGAHGVFLESWNQSNSAAVSLFNSGAIEANLDGVRLLNNGPGKATATNSGRIEADRGIALFNNSGMNTGGAEIVNSGVIVANGAVGALEEWDRPHGIYMTNFGTGAATVANSNAVTSDNSDGIWLSQAGTAAATLGNSGAVTAGRNGLHISAPDTNTGGVVIRNRGVVKAKNSGIRAWNGGSGPTHIVNIGAITADGAFSRSGAGDLDSIGIRISEPGAGDLTVDNSADITANNYGIYARKEGTGGAVTIIHRSGDIVGKGNAGIAAIVGTWRDEGSPTAPAPTNAADVRVDVRGGSVTATEIHGKVAIAAENSEGGSAIVMISEGATVTATHNVGVYAYLADRQNAAGQIRIEQAGTISAPGGVYATVTRYNLEGETRPAAAQPVIDIDWAGTFARAGRGAPAAAAASGSDGGRTFEQAEHGALVQPDNIAHAIEVMQEAQGKLAFGIYGEERPAIHAEVMAWRQVNRLVTAGDDPGEIADAEAQAKLLATDSSDATVAARAKTVLDSFRAVLTNENLGAIPDAGDIDTDKNGEFSDPELKKYLMADSAARRTELRDLLRRNLSGAERAVLNALVAGRDPVAALAAVSGASEDWKSGVRALARQFNDGNIDIDVNGGSIDAPNIGVRAWYALPHAGNGAIDVTIAAGASVSGGVTGVYVANAGMDADGNRRQAVTVHGAVAGGTGAAVHLAGGGTVTVADKGRVKGDIRAAGGALTFVSPAGGTVAGTVHDPAGSLTVNGTVGRILYSAGGTVTVGKTGRIAGDAESGEAIRSDAGALSVTVAGTVSGGILAKGEDGALTFVSPAGGTVAGTVHDPAGSLTVNGTVGRILYSAGGTVTVGKTGRIAGDAESGEAIRSDAGALNVTVAGTVSGEILANGEGGVLTLAVLEGGVVTGTLRDPASPLMIGGTVGRILYSAGGTVTMASTGRVTGVGGEAIRAGDGALRVTLAGAGDGARGSLVEGDIRSGGTLTVADAEGAAGVPAGATVAGTIHSPASSAAKPFTVRGSVGRLLLDSGGSVAVAAGGAVTGVSGEADAIRSMAGNLAVDVKAKGAVRGNIRAEGDGNLDVKVSGSVEGGVFGLGGGEHNVHVMTGGAVSGRIHLEASAVTVDGSSGPVLLDRGGEVSVGPGGRVTRADGEADAIRSAAGDLTVTVNGDVIGDIDGRGDGDMTITVAKLVDGSVFAGNGGMHRADIGADGVVTGILDGFSAIGHSGKAGGFRLPAGGRINAAPGSEITGVQQDGMLVAIDAPKGALTADLNGTVGGAVLARDADAASGVTVGDRGDVAGVVQLAGAGSAVAVEGEVRIVDIQRGGMVTIGENGRIEEGVREPRQGAVVVLVRAAPGETAADAGKRVGSVAGGRGIEVKVRPSGAPDSGADDVTLEIDAGGRLAVPGLVPVGAAVYAALPSVLLAFNELPDFGDLMSSAGARRGVWTRFHGGRGDRSLAAPTGQDRRHDIRRYSFEAGIEGAAGENGRVSMGVHHVRGEADIEGTEGGGVKMSGTGARISGAWFSAGGYYAGAQAAATLYEADLNSIDPKAERGELKHDLSGRGYALGVEAGRRLDVRGVAVTPRVGASWSAIAMSSFTDSAGQRVSLDSSRSIKARAGLRAEARGLFGTVDVERELSGRMDATAGDTLLRSEAESTWVRLGLGGAHEWNEGRVVLRGSANYAAARGGNRDFGGSASLTVRF